VRERERESEGACRERESARERERERETELNTPILIGDSRLLMYLVCLFPVAALYWPIREKQ